MPVTAFTDIYPDGPASAAQGGVSSADGPQFNPDYPGMPVGASPISRDLVSTAAGTVVVWQPGPSSRFVLVSAVISTDTGGRIALVDDTDSQGRRPVDAYFAANAGASPNLVPVPYVAQQPGAPLRLVAPAGNTRVRVSGWERAD